MSDTHAESEPAFIRTQLSWRTAIINAWNDSGRDYVLKSTLVSSLASILRMLQGFVLQGFILWIALGTVMLLLHLEEDARLQRKAIRKQSQPTQSTQNTQPTFN